jgi:ABC-type branched-subunit amino acid transport system ATPase component
LLTGDYRLILLDEPTSGVNPKLIQKISEIIRLMKSQGKTVFLIEHNMAFIRQTADEVAFIINGKIHTKGAPETILKNEVIIKNYLGLA